MPRSPRPAALPGASVVVDGVRLHLVRHGSAPDGSSLPVLLLHGLGTTADLWTDVVHDLAARPGPGRRCLAPDLAGLGRSETPVGRRLDLAAQATLLRGLLDAEGVPRALVVGHCLGASVAVHLAAAAPDRVAGLVLCAAPLHADAGGVPRPPVPAAARLLDAVPRPLAERAGVPSPGPVRFAAAVDLPAVEEAWRTVRTAQPLVPVLLLWGAADPLLPPSYGRRVAAEVPEAAWVPVADAGHLLPLERPERVAEEVAAFAGEVEAGLLVAGGQSPDQ